VLASEDRMMEVVPPSCIRRSIPIQLHAKKTISQPHGLRPQVSHESFKLVRAGIDYVWVRTVKLVQAQSLKGREIIRDVVYMGLGLLRFCVERKNKKLHLGSHVSYGPQ